MNYFEPRVRAISKLAAYENEPEMTEYESAVLCGLIREKKPTKLVEVGVAAGGTTAIIMQCMNDLQLDCEMYSCDLNEMYYRQPELPTGFLFKQSANQFDTRKHKFLLGKYLPDFLSGIGKGIDLAVIDTVHSMPGEVLDCLAILPYMSPDGLIILHDVAFAQYIIRSTCPNTLLLASVVGDKVDTGKDTAWESGYPNIGGFYLNDDTRKYTENIFRSMMMNWDYMPDEKELDIYRKWFINFYSRRELDLFEAAIINNRKWIEAHSLEHEIMKRSSKCLELPTAIFREAAGSSHVVLWGHGRECKKWEGRFLESGVKIDFIIDKNAGNAADSYGIDVIHPDAKDLRESKIIIMSSKYEKEIADELKNKGIENFMTYKDFYKNVMRNAFEFLVSC